VNDCPHRRSAVMMRAHYPDHCAECAREDAAAASSENDLVSDFSRDVLSLTAALYGVLALVVVIGLVAVIRSQA
jgi:hypothetical protein